MFNWIKVKVKDKLSELGDMLNKLITAFSVLVLILLILLSFRVYLTPKLATINVQVIVKESKACKVLLDGVENFRIKKQAEINTKQQEIAKLNTQLQAGANSMSIEEKGKLVDQMQKQGAIIDKFRSFSDGEIRAKADAVLKQINALVNPILEKYGAEENLVILNIESVVYAPTGLDISKKIAAALDTSKNDKKTK
jgi:Skp family chaperone for outer membrane proteins